MLCVHPAEYHGMLTSYEDTLHSYRAIICKRMDERLYRALYVACIHTVGALCGRVVPAFCNHIIYEEGVIL